MWNINPITSTRIFVWKSFNAGLSRRWWCQRNSNGMMRSKYFCFSWLKIPHVSLDVDTAIYPTCLLNHLSSTVTSCGLTSCTSWWYTNKSMLLTDRSIAVFTQNSLLNREKMWFKIYWTAGLSIIPAVSYDKWRQWTRPFMWQSLKYLSVPVTDSPKVWFMGMNPEWPTDKYVAINYCNMASFHVQVIWQYVRIGLF